MRIADGGVPTAGLGRFKGRVGQLWRNPTEIVSALRLSVGFRVAPLLKELVLGFGAHSPRVSSTSILDRLYRFTRPYLKDQATVAFATTRFNSLTIEGVKESGSKNALVFLLRGQLYYPHNLHNYLVGCALRDLGYKVSFVYCSGEVECCGVNQNSPDFSLGPPSACGFCKTIADNISLRGFDIINLNEYKSVDEEETVSAIAAQPADKLFAYELDGIRLGEALKPFLMRFFFGDYRMIRATSPAVIDHFKSAARFLGRFNNLVDQVRPSCLCFFNGLFFPESLFVREAEKRQIPTLFSERGMRKNSLFVSLNDPACHYRSDQLWDSVNQQITKEQIDTAKSYLADRVTGGPEDPTGVRRNLVDNVKGKYLRLAETPYVIFFAPVVHDTASMEKDDVTGGVFEALKTLCELAVELRQRLIVRSHPDERSAHNPSRYTIREYLADHGLLHDDYVLCLDSSERWDPYLLAESARAIVIFNGTLGMELPALGYEIFNVSASNYTGKGFTNDIKSREDFAAVFKADGRRLSDEKKELALKYFYYYVFVANISVDSLLDEKPFRFDLAQGVTAADQKVQIDSIMQRVEFLLSSSTANVVTQNPPA